MMDNRWDDFIGNDWQSSRNARQGFLDYVAAEAGRQATAAAHQFTAATEGLPGAYFETRSGDPAEVLQALAADPSTSLLVLGRRVFQVVGRPSIKRLARDLVAGAPCPLLLLP
jgi:nucleotide-binding universal stress UspA family protein